MSLTRYIGIALALLLSLVAGPAAADEFVSLPKLGGKNEKLKIRVVRYDGSTNGKMVVDVKNTAKTSQQFLAEGLYFIPDGDPEQAPQRLGAAGPFVIVGEADPVSLQKVAIEPGKTVQLQLDVFCIDSHRGSPSSETKFSVAGKRMPKKLREDISKSNAKIYDAYKGDVGAATGEIQSNTWKQRDKKWIKLEGERAKEK